LTIIKNDDIIGICLKKYKVAFEKISSTRYWQMYFYEQ